MNVNEVWKIDGVTYRPFLEDVVVSGFYHITAPSGRASTVHEVIHLTQTELQVYCPEGVTVWGDQEVLAAVADKVGLECVFMTQQEPAPET